MGSTNHGTQEITHEYFEEATAEEFNKRHLDVQPIGIYKGGYFARVSDVEITLSTFTAEIGDANEQINVKTSALATITTALLDSGNLDSGTPFIVLRWAFVEQQNNYVEIHAIASVAAAQANDIIVGKVVFAGADITGFDYNDRTFLNIQDLFFKVETSSGLYVQLRAGRIQDGSQCILVPEQTVGPFAVPGVGNSRIDLIYIATDGTVTIQQGTPAVSPSVPDYGNKLVVAEVRLVNGDVSIPADRITDVRAFLDASAGFTPSTYTGGESVTHPNGEIIKSGYKARSGVTTTVTFATPFPNALRSAHMTPVWSTGGNYSPVILPTPTASQMQIYDADGVTGFYWWARGY